MKYQTLNLSLTIDKRIDRIKSLNLDPIIVKLMDANEGEYWTLDQCLTVEKWYKRFLILNLKFSKTSIVPNAYIDIFWHYHILDTMKYKGDCDFCFGYFLHHFPYFGLRGVDDKKNQIEAFEQTIKLFEDEFFESLGELNKVFAGEMCKSQKEAVLAATCTGNNCGNSNCQGNNCNASCSSVSYINNRPTFQLL